VMTALPARSSGKSLVSAFIVASSSFFALYPSEMTTTASFPLRMLVVILAA